MSSTKNIQKWKEQKKVDELIEALLSKDIDIKIAAAKALGELGDVRAVEPLIQLLKDIDPNVRRQAIESLGEIGNKEAVEPLFQILKDDESGYTSATAARALKIIGVFPEHLLLNYLASLSDKYIEWSEGVLGEIIGLNSINNVSILNQILKITDSKRLKIHIAKRISEIEGSDDDNLNRLINTMMHAIRDKHHGVYDIDKVVSQIDDSWFTSVNIKNLLPFLDAYLKYYTYECSCHYGTTLAIIKKIGVNTEILIPTLLECFMIDGYQMDDAIKTLNKINPNWVSLSQAQELIPSIIKKLDAITIEKSYAIERLGLFGPFVNYIAPRLIDIVLDSKQAEGFREYALKSLEKIIPKSLDLKRICQNLVFKHTRLSTIAKNILQDEYHEVPEKPEEITIAEDITMPGLRTIVSNAKNVSWTNLDDFFKLKQAIKNTWNVDCQVLSITEQQAQILALQGPRHTNVCEIKEEYQITLSDNSIFIHAHGAFIDFGYVMFLYHDKLYYVNVEPTVQLVTSIYNRMDVLSHMAKIMILLNKYIGSERNTLLIRLEGDLLQC